MKGDFRSFSRRGLKSSKSLRVVQDSEIIVDALKESFWETMPNELLRDVLSRIEKSEEKWPERKDAVACGGVCKIWRESMREIIKTLEFSAKLTFPIALKQPGPRDSLIHCYIKRNRSTQTYFLYLSLNEASNDDGKFLLAARKFRHATCTDYVISLNSKDFSKGSSSYIGKLRSNFLGSKFTVFDAQPPNAGAKVTKSCSSKLIGVKQISPKVPPGNYPVAHISYELNVLGSSLGSISNAACINASTPLVPEMDGRDVLVIFHFESVTTSRSSISEISSLDALMHEGPRRMSCVMDAIPASATKPNGVAPTPTEFVSIHTVDSSSSPSLSFFRSKSTHLNRAKSDPFSPPNSKAASLVMKNKSPRWHEQLQCWCLNFNGRVTVASVKNFQLVASAEGGERGAGGAEEDEKVIIQFGKVGKDVFTMDYRYPISAFQAFAICLSSFDTKIACE